MLKVHMPARLIRAYGNSCKIDGSEDSTNCCKESGRIASLPISKQFAV